MDHTRVQFAESSNGDRWFLLNGGAHYGVASVIHEANLASGGTTTTSQLSEFLKRDVDSPQHSALLEFFASTNETEKRGHDPAPPELSSSSGSKSVHRSVPYEPGMHILWDMLTREIVVIFRGAVISAQQRFDSREQAVSWGEDLCKDCGWTGMQDDLR